MSLKKDVKMLQDYKFAELPQCGGQIHDVKKDDVVNVSLQIADMLIQSKKAEDVVEQTEEAVKDEKKEEGKKIPSFLRQNPAQADKANAEVDK